MAKATEGYLFPSCFARKKLSPSKITYEAAARPDLRIGTRQQPCFAFCEQGAPKRGAPDVRDLSRALRLIKHREVDKKTERCADKARVGAGSGFRCGETYPETRICYPTLLG